MIKLNNKGAVLISVYMVLFVLMTLSSSVAMFNFSELRDSRRYQDATAAFWLAEAGINQFMADTALLDEAESRTFIEERGTIQLSKNDSDPRYRTVIAKGIVGGSQREIQIRYPVISSIFERTISTRGDLLIEGIKSSLIVNDKLRLSGSVINTSTYPRVFIEDKQEGVRESLVSIIYPDVNRNGVTDEFDDFVAYNRSLLANYPEEDVIYVKGNDTYTIVPDSSLQGKKIIYVEGDREGEGNVVLQFSSALKKGQNLTIIATGTVTHNQSGFAHKDSQLNIIAWSGYFETAALPSSHNGVIFTHGKAYFDEIHDTSTTNGSIVANEGIVIREVWSTKTFNYADMRKQGSVPPGFEGLISGGITAYSEKPNSWKEI
jgi:hypothetical protein